MLRRRKLIEVKSKPITLVIDGEVLLKQGFNGTKNTVNERGYVGTIYYFLNVIRKFYINNYVSKVVVFWEGENSRKPRQAYYPGYKKNREEFNPLTEEQISDLNWVRNRIKQYLEELFIRQYEADYSEGDDCIAYYCNNSKNERKIIYSNDRDLLQLIDGDTVMYLADKKITINIENYNKYFKHHHKNIVIIKMIGGDASDNISGIKNIAEKTILKIFPELKDEEKDIEWIKKRSNELLKEESTKPTIKNSINRILNGETKWGVYGDEYFMIMNKIINLSEPFLDNEHRENIDILIEGVLDPEGRGDTKKVIEMFHEDGLDFYLGTRYHSEFFRIFKIIINKEKAKYHE